MLSAHRDYLTPSISVWMSFILSLRLPVLYWKISYCLVLILKETISAFPAQSDFACGLTCGLYYVELYFYVPPLLRVMM